MTAYITPKASLSLLVKSTLMVKLSAGEQHFNIDRICDTFIFIHTAITAVKACAAVTRNNLMRSATLGR